MMTMFYRNSFYANGLDPDRMPHSGASDLCLDFLPISHLWDARHKWTKPKQYGIKCESFGYLLY